MNLKTYSLGAAAALAVLLQPSTALAAEAVSNLGENQTGQFGVSSLLNYAQGFTTGNSGLGSLTLESVVIRANQPDGAAASGFTLQLFSNPASFGGPPIATLIGSDPSGAAFANYTFTAPPNTLLADNTSYWLVASATSTGAFGWANTTSDAQTGSPGWAVLDSSYIKLGSQWDVAPDSEAMMLAVNVIPEPSTYAAGLLLAGAIGSLCWRRRTR